MKVTFNDLSDGFASQLIKTDARHAHAKSLAGNDYARMLFRIINGKIQVEPGDTVEAKDLYLALDEVNRIVWDSLAVLRLKE